MIISFIEIFKRGVANKRIVRQIVTNVTTVIYSHFFEKPGKKVKNT